MIRCHKCGEETLPAFFNHSGTICDDCWAILDMDRFREARPPKGEAPVAPIVKLSNDRGFGILCPHCDHKVERRTGYFHRAEQVERCPKCMEHYRVKTRNAK